MSDPQSRALARGHVYARRLLGGHAAPSTDDTAEGAAAPGTGHTYEEPDDRLAQALAADEAAWRRHMNPTRSIHAVEGEPEPYDWSAERAAAQELRDWHRGNVRRQRARAMRDEHPVAPPVPQCPPKDRAALMDRPALG